MVSEPNNGSEIFFSYSHKDQVLREELETQLSLLKRQGYISSWHDRKIGAGEEWAQEIDKHLNSAQIILLLVSADFIASNYCYEREMMRAIERHKGGEAHVIPVILRPCEWHHAPFGHLQALPTDGQPVTSRSWHSRDEAFLNVAQGIRKAIEGLRTTSSTIDYKVGSLSTTDSAESEFALPIWNVPYRRNPFFTGRKKLLQRIHDRFITNQISKLIRPQALTGLGGIGKTQVAVEYAYRYRSEYNAILWFRATTHDTLLSDIATSAELLDQPEKDEQDQNKVVTAVKIWLATHSKYLIILLMFRL